MDLLSLFIGAIIAWMIPQPAFMVPVTNWIKNKVTSLGNKDTTSPAPVDTSAHKPSKQDTDL